jgi:beta-glucosidase
LPLDTARVKTIALIGRHADKGVVSGGGSSQVDPLGGKVVDPPSDAHDPVAVLFARTWDLSSPLQAIKAKAPAARIRYASGEDPADAARLAAASDVAIVLAYDSRREGLDTPSLSLPDGQDGLIERVAAANRHTIVVLETGGPCLTPWADKVAALLEAWYPGNRGGQAIAAVLFGDVNPSGKLPVTFPRREADLPRASIVGFPDPAGADMGRVPPRLLDVALSEGVRVGYKWFDSRSESPQFPFGYGLSYTSFSYSNLHVASGKPFLQVFFNVSNTGSRAGTEIAEVYARLPAATDEPRRLVGWARVALKEREIKGVVVPIDPLALSTWDVAAQRWQVPRGRYEFYVGGSSRELPLHAIWNRS